jgi:DNA topoisomerase VI subunit A
MDVEEFKKLVREHLRISVRMDGSVTGRLRIELYLKDEEKAIDADWVDIPSDLKD